MAAHQASPSLGLGKYKLKPQCDNTTPPLDWSKKKSYTTDDINTGRMRSNLSSHAPLAGMQNVTTTLDISFAVSYELNIYLPYDPTISLIFFTQEK